MESETKTSDEILEELFSALNVPLSPKSRKALPPESRDSSPESEASDDKEAGSKSSDSDDEHKPEEEISKEYKHKSSKRKKDKKKKKKKHKKKDEDGRHKSKKKHKRSSVSESQDSSPLVLKPEVVTKAEDVLVKTEEVVEEVLSVLKEEVTSNNVENTKPEEQKITPSISESVEEEVVEIVKENSNSKVNRNDTSSDPGIKDESTKKVQKKLKSPLKSPLRSNSSSKSLHSRSRSPSRARHRQSRSRSRHNRRSRSKSRSRLKHGSGRSRSRSGSRSKIGNRYSRSSSKTSYNRSSARSPIESSRVRRKRFSRSRSRSTSPRLKRRRYSVSRSKSPISRRYRKRSRSRSKSISPKLSRGRRYLRSRSPSSSKIPSYRSRSKSRSPKRTSQLKDISHAFQKAFEASSSKIESLKEQVTVDIDLNSIPTPDAQLPPNISLESIPLPIPPESIGLPDPSSIPLPQPVIPGIDQSNEKKTSELKSAEIQVIESKPVENIAFKSIENRVPELKSGEIKVAESKSGEIDLGAIPVPGSASEDPHLKDGESAKGSDAGAEKNKAKTIVIKSLKDSLIYLQAQEEAERRAKEKQDDPTDLPVQNDKEDVGVEEQQSESKDDGAYDIVDDMIEEILELAKMNEAKELHMKQESAKEAPSESKAKKEKSKDTESTKKIKNGDNSEMEDGEILSETESPKTKSHKKKSKKDKDKDKDKDKEKDKTKEKKKKSKDKTKEKKKHSKDKAGSKERSVRSRSRSKDRSKHKKSSSWHRDHDLDRRHRRYSRSRSRSRDRHARFRHRSYSRSRSRSRSRTGRKRDCVTDLRDKVTRKRLLEIARRNAVYLMQNGCLPPNVEQEQLVKIKTGGKSVEELTDFCKQLVATGNYSDAELSDPSLSSDEDNDNPDKPFNYTRHPFNVKDSKPILMNIRNAPMLPTKTNAERLADHAKLREQFPVSSGSQHRNKGETNTTEDKPRTADSGWVPVSPKEKKAKEEDTVFSKEKPPSVDISQIVSSRLSAMRKLQDNPHDMEAIKTLHNVQKEMQSWALSKQEPGQFTGSTGVKILSQEELCAGQQAWVRKEQFKEAAPVRPQFGLKMLQKMGWTPGEGLGKNKEGAIEPLLLDVKMDKKGFHAQEELTPKKQPIPMAKDLSGKHPVSALVELCSKHKWQPPEFEMVFDYGPDHKKNFLMKVKVNGQEYKPAVAGPTKKLAKANAAAACLQSLGLFPKDMDLPLTE